MFRFGLAATLSWYCFGRLRFVVSLAPCGAGRSMTTDPLNAVNNGDFCIFRDFRSCCPPAAKRRARCPSQLSAAVRRSRCFGFGLDWMPRLGRGGAARRDGGEASGLAARLFGLTRVGGAEGAFVVKTVEFLREGELHGVVTGS